MGCVGLLSRPDANVSAASRWPYSSLTYGWGIRVASAMAAFATMAKAPAATIVHQRCLANLYKRVSAAPSTDAPRFGALTASVTIAQAAMTRTIKYRCNTLLYEKVTLEARQKPFVALLHSIRPRDRKICKALIKQRAPDPVGRSDFVVSSRSAKTVGRSGAGTSELSTCSARLVKRSVRARGHPNDQMVGAQEEDVERLRWGPTKIGIISQKTSMEGKSRVEGCRRGPVCDVPLIQNSIGAALS